MGAYNWVQPLNSMRLNMSYLLMCNRCQGLFGPEYREQHDAFHESLSSREEARAMSAVAWCNPGNHAFEAGIPGSESGTMTVRDEEGQPITKTFDACPEHSFQSQRKAKAEAIGSASEKDERIR